MDWPKSSLGFFYKMLPASYMTLAHSRNLDSIQRQKRTTKEFFPHLKLPITLSSDDQFYQLHTLVPKTPRYTHKHAKHMYTHTCMLSHFGLCLPLCDPMDYSLPRSFVHGILQARALKWVAMNFVQEIFHTQG